MARPRILYPANYSADFGRGKDRTRRRKKMLGSVLSAAKEGYRYGKGTLGRIGSAIDLGASAAALKVAGSAGKFGLKGIGRAWKRKYSK